MALLDQLLETYVESFKQGRDVPHKETREIIASFKNQIICEVKEILTCEEKEQMRVTARIEKEKILAEANAKAEKTESEARKKAKRINNKQTRAFIIDAILLALLVGIIVNQATFLLPEGTISALLIILISLLCIVLVFIFQTRE